MTDKTVRRYRFRVRTSDGRELTSAVAKLKLPPLLARAQWSHAEGTGGDEVKLSVEAQGRDGETIQFALERESGGAWEPVDHVSAPVEQGRAQVSRALPHLPATKAGAHHKLRFRAFSADGREAISARLALRPSAALAEQPTLRLPHFGHASYLGGNEAELSVDATGLEGRAVRFFVERREGQGWEPLAEAAAEARSGHATAHVALPDPPAATEIRFRAVGAFGDNATSPAVPLAPRSSLLKNPQWSHTVKGKGARYRHGETAGMRVEAPGLDGSTVRFVVEQQQGGKWDALATVTARVEGGVAEAPLPVEHPAAKRDATRAELRATPALPLRFRAELA